MHEHLTSALADAADFLQSRAIPFAVIGGIASSVRGEPRVTSDVDLVIGVDVARALELLHSLGDSPFEPLFSGAEEVVERSFILPVKHRASGVRVDMAIGLSGFEKDAIARAEIVNIGSKIAAPVASIEDLLVMKILAGRSRDMDDARSLVSLRFNQIDWAYVEQTAQELGDTIGMDLAATLRQLATDAQ